MQQVQSSNYSELLQSTRNDPPFASSYDSLPFAHYIHPLALYVLLLELSGSSGTLGAAAGCGRG